MAMSSTGSTGAVKAEPNVTPLIDVMLVLLIIFMIVTPLINSGFQAQPPDGVNIKAHPEENSDQVLGIDANGQYYLNKKFIPNNTLAAQVKEIYSQPGREDFVMYLKADRNLKYAKVLDAIDIVDHNGVRVLAAITDQTPGTRSSVPGDILSPTPNKP
ncbi:MAG TPA: biopolymer transporter ExbD [Gemmatimonadaceae bacterium]|nr:biopolymer transporter ExbD [Gemmatimonadaceae bacterium]